MVTDTVSIGGEIGIIKAVRAGEGAVVLSLNGTYYLSGGQGERRARPFLTGGYSLLFSEGHINLWNIGGGFDYWVGKRAGLRVELCDHLFSDGYAAHAWGARVGLLFR